MTGLNRRKFCKASATVVAAASVGLPSVGSAGEVLRQWPSDIWVARKYFFDKYANVTDRGLMVGVKEWLSSLSDADLYAVLSHKENEAFWVGVIIDSRTCGSEDCGRVVDFHEKVFGGSAGQYADEVKGHFQWYADNYGRDVAGRFLANIRS